MYIFLYMFKKIGNKIPLRYYRLRLHVQYLRISKLVNYSNEYIQLQTLYREG